MQVANDIHAFGKACENLLASIVIHRPLTETELLLVRHYCHKVLKKTAPAPTILAENR